MYYRTSSKNRNQTGVLRDCLYAPPVRKQNSVDGTEEQCQWVLLLRRQDKGNAVCFACLLLLHKKDIAFAHMQNKYMLPRSFRSCHNIASFFLPQKTTKGFNN